jgi:precorrin-6x reductase
MNYENAMSIARDDAMSKSKRIQTLFDGGYEVNEIHKMVGVIYNHAYNVVSNYVIKNGIQVEKSESAGGSGGRKAEIVARLKEGMKIIDIQRELKCDYSQVWKIKNELFPKTDEDVAAAVAKLEEIVNKESEVTSKPGNKVDLTKYPTGTTTQAMIDASVKAVAAKNNKKKGSK